jgi:hypothetical protein
MSRTPAITDGRAGSKPTLPRRALLVLAVLAAMGAMVASAQLAAATHYNYCTAVLSPYDHCDGDTHSLTASQVYDDYGSNNVCAGATDTSGAFYGSYACGNGFAEHCYSGSNLLIPRIHNSESFAQQMHGAEYYNETCP